jgi:hypothetical protein
MPKCLKKDKKAEDTQVSEEEASVTIDTSKRGQVKVKAHTRRNGVTKVKPHIRGTPYSRKTDPKDQNQSPKSDSPPPMIPANVIFP